MKWLRKNLGAAILVAAAAASLFYVFIVDRNTITTDERELRKNNLFPAWRNDQVSRVAVKAAGHDVLLVAKKHVSITTGGADAAPESEGREWDVTIDGATYSADDQAVDKLLGTLDHALMKREIAKASVDRAAFGLDAPRETVDVTMGEITMHLAIGAAASVKDETYAEVKDRGVFAISSELAASLMPNPDELRSKSFVPYVSSNLTALSLRGEGGDRDFERAPWHAAQSSAFQIKGEGIRVDADLMDRLFVAFGKMQAGAFLADDIADKASTARVTLTLVPKAGENAVIVLGGACPTKKDAVVAIRKSPTRLNACVPSLVMDALTQPLSAFEDKHLVGAAFSDFVELAVEDGDKKLEIARSGSGFKMRSPADRLVSGDRGNALINDMILVKGELAPSDAPTEGTPVTVTIRSAGFVDTSDTESERVEVLLIYPAKEDKETGIARSVVVRKEDGRKLYVSRSLLHGFAANDLLVRDLTVTKEKPEDVAGLSIESAGKKQVLERSEKGFELREPKGPGLVADAGFAAELAGELAHIETTRWIADKDDGSFGLGTPRISLAAKLLGRGAKPGDERAIKLSIGARTDEGSYAKLEPDGAVFLAPNALVEDASRWLVSRSAFAVSAESIEKLVLRGEGDKRLELVRDGKRLVIKGKTDHKGDELSATVARAMDDLLPIAAVSIGAADESQGLKKPLLEIAATTTAGDVNLQIGSGDTFERTSIHYARRGGIDATYAVPASVVSTLLDAVAAR